MSVKMIRASLYFLVGIAPYVEVALRRIRGSLTRRLEPWMLIGCVIHDELDHHLQVAVVSGLKKCPKIVDRAIHRVNVQVIGYVIAVILERRGEKRQQPQASDAQILQIIQFLQQSRKIADSIRIAVLERADMQFIDDGILVPQRICCAARPFCHDSFLCALPGAVRFRMERDDSKRGKPQVQRERPGMHRERNSCQTAEISLSASAIQRSVAVQRFSPGTLQGNAYAVILSNHWSEITHE